MYKFVTNSHNDNKKFYINLMKKYMPDVKYQINPIAFGFRHCIIDDHFGFFIDKNEKSFWEYYKKEKELQKSQSTTGKT